MLGLYTITKSGQILWTVELHQDGVTTGDGESVSVDDIVKIQATPSNDQIGRTLARLALDVAIGLITGTTGGI